MAYGVLDVMRNGPGISGLSGDVPPEVEFGEFLRRSLHAAAESIEPAGDGLERIYARLGHSWRPRTRQVGRPGAAGMIAHPAAAGLSEA